MGLAQENGLGASTRCLCCIGKSMLRSEYTSVRSLPTKPALLPFPLSDHWIPEGGREKWEAGIHSPALERNH